MSDPADHTLDLAPSPSRGGSRGGGRKKSAARQNSNRRRRSAGAAGLIDESGERIDELIDELACSPAEKLRASKRAHNRRLQATAEGKERRSQQNARAYQKRLHLWGAEVGGDHWAPITNRRSCCPVPASAVLPPHPAPELRTPSAGARAADQVSLDQLDQQRQSHGRRPEDRCRC